ncbi:hypothetical protein [Bacillus sp. GB_SG_008]|uniref:hypothetical protein n=1 Tax=Bacillus sp. GB_SG_008 TaxID=3454627 RepID=UPI003F8689C7
MLFKKFIKKKYVCLVCGYNRLPGPLYNEKRIPNVSLICACCAFQPGYDDEEIGWTIEAYRENWLQEGATWLDPKKKPKHWDLKQQLANINIKK